MLLAAEKILTIQGLSKRQFDLLPLFSPYLSQSLSLFVTPLWLSLSFSLCSIFLSGLVFFLFLEAAFIWETMWYADSMNIFMTWHEMSFLTYFSTASLFFIYLFFTRRAYREPSWAPYVKSFSPRPFDSFTLFSSYSPLTKYSSN